MADARMLNGDNAITKATRNAQGQWIKGASGHAGVDGTRARKALNVDTIKEMHAVFREQGRAIIEKVAKHQPAVFLKLLVLLVPREMEVTHRGGVKSMSDEQLEQAIEAVQAMLERREQGVVDVTPNPPEIPQIPGPKKKAKTRKAQADMGVSMGKDDETPNP